MMNSLYPFFFQIGAPVLLSTPHFYMGDEKYVKAFEGLEPVQEWHETHFDLEPVIRKHLFFQANF